MNKKILTVAATLGLALISSSCMQRATSPTGYHGDHADTANEWIHVDSVDVHVICPRATGKSHGFKLLGFIPIRLASETEAVNNMYQDARNRNSAPEGRASQFINHSYEYSSNYRFLYSRPEIRASADLVEILPPGKGIEILRARDAAKVVPAAPKVEEKPTPEPKKSSSKKKKR